jgi:pilus assembly protein Flp/PilA
MNTTKRIARAAWNDESGQDLIEYALVAALIGLAAITGMKAVATSVKSAYTYVSATLTSAV